MLLPNVCWHPPNCYPPNKDATDLCYLLHGCANASLNKFPFAHAKSPTKFHRQSCYPPNQDATDLFYLLYGCANACLNKFPFAHTKTLSSSQLLPTNKDCACTPPEAELHKLRVLQCTYSARTVHATVHATVHGHNTLQIPWDERFFDNSQKKYKNIVFFVFASFWGKYVVFTAFCGRALWRAL